MTTCPICQAKISSFGGYYVMLPENQGPRARTESVCSLRCLLVQQTDYALDVHHRIGEADGYRKGKAVRWWR